MDNEDVKIGEFILRVPELAEEEAGAIGKEVAIRLVEGISSKSKLHQLGALDLCVMVPPKVRRSHMVLVIAKAILKGLG
jgi:hypothetical protein